MVNIGTREEYYKIKTKKIYGKQDCPFCDLKKNEEFIVWKGKNWYLIINKFPYSGNEKHLMAVPYKHKKFFLDLNNEDLLELKEIHKFVKNWFGDDNYFSCTRESFGNRSVEHFHMHFVPGRLQGKYLRKMLENQGYPIHQELDINEKKYRK